MKKHIISILIVSAALLCGCKDELQDTLFDKAFFEAYDGHEVRFLDLQFEQEGNDYVMHCNLMTYSSKWPRGTFQLRYGRDHEFGNDTLLYTENPVSPDAAAITTLSYLIRRNDVFKPWNTVFVKPYYITESGDVCEGMEAVFDF